MPNNIGIIRSIEDYSRSGFTHFDKLKEKLTSEINDIPTLNGSQKKEILKTINTIDPVNYKTQLTILKNKVTLLTTPTEAADSGLTSIAKNIAGLISDNILSQIAPSIAKDVNEYLGKRNAFVDFESEIDNLLEINALNSKEVSEIINENIPRLSVGLQIKYPQLTSSQISSILANIEIKSKFIEKGTTPDQIKEGLQGIKVLLDHNLKNENKLDWRKGEVDALFKGVQLNTNFFKACIETPKNHPEWCYFLSEASRMFPDANEDQINDLFKSLMKASVFELEATVFEENVSGKLRKDPTRKQLKIQELREKPVIDGSALFIRSKAFDTKVGSVRKELGDEGGKKITEGGAAQIYASTKQVIGSRTLNPHYAEAFQKFVALDHNNTMYLDSRAGFDAENKEASLWSGNSDVSVFASEHAAPKLFRVLEKTKLGKLFDRFEQHSDWKIQYPLWNILSKGFVHAEISRQIENNQNPVVLNYNFRTLDPTTIGSLIEMPTAMYSLVKDGNPNRKLEMHLRPLYTDSKAKGGMRQAAEHVISLDRTNFEHDFKLTADKFKSEIMQELQERKTEIKHQLQPEVDKIVRTMTLNKSHIDEELQRLRRVGGTLTPDEEISLREKLSLEEAIEYSTSDIQDDWQLIKDNSYAIGELELEPTRITKIKEEAAKFKTL